LPSAQNPLYNSIPRLPGLPQSSTAGLPSPTIPVRPPLIPHQLLAQLGGSSIPRLPHSPLGLPQVTIKTVFKIYNYQGIPWQHLAAATSAACLPTSLPSSISMSPTSPVVQAECSRQASPVCESPKISEANELSPQIGEQQAEASEETKTSDLL